MIALVQSSLEAVLAGSFIHSGTVRISLLFLGTVLTEYGLFTIRPLRFLNASRAIEAAGRITKSQIAKSLICIALGLTLVMISASNPKGIWNETPHDASEDKDAQTGLFSWNHKGFDHTFTVDGEQSTGKADNNGSPITSIFVQGGTGRTALYTCEDIDDPTKHRLATSLTGQCQSNTAERLGYISTDPSPATSIQLVDCSDPNGIKGHNASLQNCRETEELLTPLGFVRDQRTNIIRPSGNTTSQTSVQHEAEEFMIAAAAALVSGIILLWIEARIKGKRNEDGRESASTSLPYVHIETGIQKNSVSSTTVINNSFNTLTYGPLHEEPKAPTLEKAPGPSKNDFLPREAKNGHGRFRAKKEKLGRQVSWPPSLAAYPDLWLSEGPCLWARLVATKNHGRDFTFLELENAVGKNGILLAPLLDIGEHQCQAHDGIGRFSSYGDALNVAGISFAFRSGEIWSIETRLFFDGSFALSEVRRRLPNAMVRFETVLGKLNIEAPYRWIVGVEGAENMRLSWGDGGPDYLLPVIRKDPILREGVFLPGDNWETALKPFYQAVFAESGMELPSGF